MREFIKHALRRPRPDFADFTNKLVFFGHRPNCFKMTEKNSLNSVIMSEKLD